MRTTHERGAGDGPAVPEPWYRNGWVWFIIAIPAATVAACLVTVYLALTHPDELVRDPAPISRERDGA